ncbi:hypothetical protein MTO96_021531 [Rhipicephalus appendiculatus]
MATGTPTMPATSRETLYLAGYSSKLYIRNVECVLSRYLFHQGDWVTRSLIYVFAIRQKPWRGETTAFKVKWPQYAALLQVNPPHYLKHNVWAKTEYVVRNYDSQSLVLSDLKGIPSLCSLWVTRKHLFNIPKTTNRTFYELCPDPVYTSFDICD